MRQGRGAGEDAERGPLMPWFEMFWENPIRADMLTGPPTETEPTKPRRRLGHFSRIR